MKISIIAGSLRKGNNTIKVSKMLEGIYKENGAQVTLIDLADMPLEAFTPESYKEKPAALQKQIDAVMSADGVLIVCPEYNGSYPGVLKHFIDMLPFPDAYENRPFAFVGIAAGQWGALRSIEHLEGIIGYRNGYKFPKRVFIAKLFEAWDFEKNMFKDDEMNQRLNAQSKNFIRFCEVLKDGGLSATA